MVNKKKLELIIVNIFLVAAFFYIPYGTKKKRERRASLNDEGGFSIGVYYSRSYSKGDVNSVAYRYTIDGKSFKGREYDSYLDSHKANEIENGDLESMKDKFLVLYDKKNPDESILRLDYPIKDSADFKRYVNEFEQMRKMKKRE